ncbi:hypothetical protein CPLU01_15358 [Colletotrichum plurivorum]|uniref:Uncharacterized protein n=1 Tax=Colletotrichum plurivorum TaxID=2175906 RepID=A0A8H6JCI1_9PEZI|nr:hypothetical protein CPLU01_15358 [Colletotrichum plurivorum]
MSLIMGAGRAIGNRQLLRKAQGFPKGMDIMSRWKSSRKVSHPRLLEDVLQFLDDFTLPSEFLRCSETGEPLPWNEIHKPSSMSIFNLSHPRRSINLAISIKLDEEWLADSAWNCCPFTIAGCVVWTHILVDNVCCCGATPTTLPGTLLMQAVLNSGLAVTEGLLTAGASANALETPRHYSPNVPYKEHPRQGSQIARHDSQDAVGP